MNVRGLDDVKFNCLDRGSAKHRRQLRSDVRIAACPLHHFLIQLFVALVSRVRWITKTSGEICVLDQNDSSRSARFHHRSETVLRLAQVREKKTSVNQIELLPAQADASIHLLKFDVRYVCCFGIFSRQRENLSVCVGADSSPFRTDNARHQARHVATPTTDVEAFHASAQTDAVQ